jgi:hypothetical protein
MYYFYVIAGPFRVGFGHTKNWQQRQKDYTGAWGGPAHFSALWQGSKDIVLSLEKTIKVEYRDLLWKASDNWYTEWFDNGWNSQQAEQFVQETISSTHLRLERVII